MIRAARFAAVASIALAAPAALVVVACGGDDAASELGRRGGPGGGDASTDATLGDDGGPPGHDAGPDTALPPLNAEDAADTPDGGARIDPGVVPCGLAGPCNVFASNQCCLDDADDASVCLAGSVSCAPGVSSFECDESADCFVGTVCCASVAPTDAGGFVIATRCQADCGGLARFCRTHGECGDAGCVVQACTNGGTYEMCGTFAGDAGGFACTPQ